MEVFEHILTVLGTLTYLDNHWEALYNVKEFIVHIDYCSYSMKSILLKVIYTIQV